MSEENSKQNQIQPPKKENNKKPSPGPGKKSDRNGGGKSASEDICRNFLQGNCRHGESCKYVHNNSTVAASNRSERKPHSNSHPPTGRTATNGSGNGKVALDNNVCRNFLQGNCRHGESCKYVHNNSTVAASNRTEKKPHSNSHPPIGRTATNGSGNGRVASDVIQFCEMTLQTMLSSSKYSFKSSEQLKLWKNSFEVAATNNKELAFCYQNLLSLYLQLTEQYSHAPKAVDVLKITVLILRTPPNKAIDSLSLISQIFERRLLRSCSMSTITDKAIIIVEIKKVNREATKLQLQFMDRMSEVTPFLTLVLKYKQDVENFEIQTSRPTANAEGDGEGDAGGKKDPSLGWLCKPTIEWLSSENWNGKRQLKEEYESVEEYVTILRNVWTTLTFYWGTAALWPRCRCVSTQQGTACSVPLLTPVLSNHSHRCTSWVEDRGGTRKCGREGAWRCFHHNSHHTQVASNFNRSHDVICKSCLSKKKEHILASVDTPESSTDLYDGVLSRVKHDQDVLLLDLSDVESRKAPKVSTNWKTSYRLQCSCLVGVVTTSMSKGPLSSNSRIYWGEIVAKDNKAINQDKEYFRRNKKELTVRIFTEQDVLGLDSMLDIPFKVENTVVIIDLHVFVPEVISVLGTLCDEKFLAGMKKIPLQTALIGDKSYFTKKQVADGLVDEIDGLNLSFQSESLKKAITYAVQHSNLECLNSRLPFSLSKEIKDTIIQDIVKIPLIESLDRTQLIAFCYALLNQFHCTQGPPGTGKSYVGVCLVLALQVIRKKLLASRKHVGPIIVLAYKNHALDEFLIDVLEAGFLKSGDSLIRSGKPEQEMLLNFTERRTKEEQMAGKELERRLRIVQSSKHVFRFWSAVFLHSASSIDKMLFFLQGTQVLMLCKEYLQQFKNDENIFSSSDLKEINIDNSITSFKVLSAFNEEDIQKNEFAHVDGKFLKSLQDHMMDSLFEEAAHWRSYRYYEGNEDADGKEVDDVIKFPKELMNASRTLKLLFLWIEGQILPPRCAFINTEKEMKKRCVNCSAWGGIYCGEEHKCKYFSCHALSQVRGGYCSKHLCHHQECTSPIIGNTEYCASHICQLCTSRPRSNKSSTCCEIHRCKKNDCVEGFISLEIPFCVHHCCSICKQYGMITKESVVSEISSFCMRHKCKVQSCLQFRISNLYENCIQHTCVYCDNAVDLSNPFMIEAQICRDHCCEYPDSPCFERKLQVDASKFSKYCFQHTCPVCIYQKSTNAEMIPPDLQTCHHHPTCQFVDNSGVFCDGICIEANEIYCPLHVQGRSILNDSHNFPLDSCCGIAKKGKPCGAKRPNEIKRGLKWYCNAHNSQQNNEKNVINLDASQVLMLSNIVKVNDKSGKVTERPTEFTLYNGVNEQDDALMLTRFAAPCSVGECSGLKIGNSHTLPWCCSLHSLQQQQTTNEGSYHTNVANEKYAARQNRKNTEVNNRNDHESFITQQQAAKKMMKKTEVLSPNNNTDISNEADYKLVMMPDDVDFKEAEGINNNPDEMEIPIDDDGEAQVEGDLAVRRELYQDDVDIEINEEEEEEQIDEDNRLDEKFDDDDMYVTKGTPLKVFQFIESFPYSLDWTMSKVEREKALQKIFKLMIIMLQQLILKSENFVDIARTEKAEANAAVFKNATVVGATIVGASRRLTALRAAEPFAIIVEEACEVMEPTLVSVLAVESLEKLELIGDQHQLPAFIQNCWYNLECTMPSIKQSLFERMIKVSNKANSKPIRRMVPNDNNESPSIDNSLVNSTYCTVLDMQRRMRTTISNITKAHYSDVVKIQDHEKTKSQLIADRLSNQDKQRLNINVLRESVWHSRGRNIPGVQQNIYFWNMMQNTESRPEKGLSACNKNEASAIVSLVQYLLAVHIPPSCITIITPYSGQKRVLIASLREGKCLPREQSDNSIIVSTVDRYQGDENDIIILSLVRSKPGNRFVSLLNRFIVATSRARLGFYIVGSKDAVAPCVQLQEEQLSGSSMNNATFQSDWKEKEPMQWTKFLEGLKSDSRIGSYLPICCPQHPTSTKLVSSAPTNNIRQFPTNDAKWCQMCTIACEYSLPCSHPCTLPCHVLNFKQHRKSVDCAVPLKRPCSRHSRIPLRCGELDVKPQETLESVLQSRWKCNIEDMYDYSTCVHQFQAACCIFQAMQRQEKPLPDCKVIVSDYIHPSCGHRIKSPKCHEKQNLEKTPPQCQELIRHTRKQCGHVKLLECCKESVEFAKPSNCVEDVEFERPRCKHVLSAKCHIKFHLLQFWNSKNILKVTNTCVKQVRNSREMVVVDEFEGNINYGSPESDLHPALQCIQSTILHRKCGHELTLPCHKVFLYANKTEPMPICNEKVTVICKCCGEKTISISCHQKQNYDLWNTFQSCPTSIPTASRQSSSISIDELRVTSFNSGFAFAQQDSLPLWELMQPSFCNTSVSLNRICGHVSTIQCVDLQRLYIGKAKLNPCENVISRQLKCGHSLNVLCHKRNSLPEPSCNSPASRNFIFPECQHTISPSSCVHLQELKRLYESNKLQCDSNITEKFFRCGHSVQIPCHLRKQCVSYKRPGLTVSGDIEKTEQDEVVIYENKLYCVPCDSLPRCTQRVTFKRTCNHTMKNQVCHDSFTWASAFFDKLIARQRAPPCKETYSLLSNPLCGHDLSIPCHIRPDVEQRWNPWESITSVDSLYKVIRRSNTDELIVKLVKYPLKCAPKLLPFEAHQHIPKCEKHALIWFEDCSHVQSEFCCDIFNITKRIVCGHSITHTCQKENCGMEIHVTCAQYRPLSTDQRIALCDNVVTRLCSLCKINSVLTPCNSIIAKCNSNVTKVLSCGHSVTWLCGSLENGPMIDNIGGATRGNNDGSTTNHRKNTQCIECAINCWDIQRMVTVKDFQLYASTMKELMKRQLGDNIKETILATELLHPNLDSHDQSKTQIYGELLSSLKALKNYNSIIFPPNITNDTVEEYLLQNYELVYLETAPTKVQLDPNTIIQRFRPQPTIYGIGTNLKKVTTSNLRQLASLEGKVRVVIGLAFRLHAISSIEVKPFIDPANIQAIVDYVKNTNKQQPEISTTNQRKEEIESIQLQRKEAHRMMTEYRQLGYDCVNIQRNDKDDDDTTATSNKNESLVFWYPGAVIPMAICTMQFHINCSVCLDSYPKDHKAGAICTAIGNEEHFTCWDCFEGYLNSAKKAGAISSYVDKSGLLCCPVPGCRKGYNLLSIAPYMPAEKQHIATDLLNFQIQYQVQSKVYAERKEIEEQMKVKFDEDMKRMREMDEVEREIYTLRKEIVEDILNNKCSRCGQAFDDFKDCCSVKCGNTQCRAYFCGYCFQDCGDHDAHQHAANCPDGIGDVFCQPEKLKEIWNRIRVRKMKAKMHGKPNAIKVKVLQSLQQDLRDLQIVDLRSFD